MAESTKPKTEMKDKNNKISNVLTSPGVIKLLPQTSAKTNFWIATKTKITSILFIIKSSDARNILNNSEISFLVLN